LSALGQRTLKKVRNRIVPMIVLLYFIAYLDRNNVGFAKASMSQDLGFSNTVFGLGAGLFFVGYVVLEIPSNAGMYRFGARKWIARILIPWGLLAAAMSLVTNETGFYTVRILLGAAEAGFFPAVLFYFTLWFPAAKRGAILGAFILAQPIANAVGAPISGLVLNLNGVLGLAGWQWLYILEGIPAIVFGCIVPFVLTDRPADAKWLDADEREWLTTTMAAELDAKRSTARHPFIAGLKDRRALVYAALNFGMVCGIYGLGLWMPSIVSQLGHFSSTQLGLVVFIPYGVAACFVYYWARRSDRTGRRAWHASVSLVTAAVGLLGAGLLLPVNPILSLVLLTVAATGIYSAIAPMLSMPSAIFAGAAAAAGLGLVNSLGNVGGFVAPFIVGVLNDATHNDQTGLLFLSGCLAVTGVAAYLYARNRPEGDTRVLIASPETSAPSNRNESR
jgi:ACS family tartrate transporter-like MFS transporter